MPADQAPLTERSRSRLPCLSRKACGVAAVYTPKDFDLTRIMADIVALVAERNGVVVGA